MGPSPVKGIELAERWKKAHHSRKGPNGARRRPNQQSRRPVIVDAAPSAIPGVIHTSFEFPPSMDPADSSWRKKGLCCIQTANTSAWETAVLCLLMQSDPSDVILLQETRLVDTLTPAQRRRAYNMGWNAEFSPAMRTIANSTSSGCAVLCRRGWNQTDLTPSLVDEWIAHRICVTRVGRVIAGGLICFSVYLKHSEQGAGPINRIVLDHLEHQLEMCKGPWCIGGDFNMTPQELLTTGFPSRVKGVVFAPSLPTCNDQTYDFFVVSDALSTPSRPACVCMRQASRLTLRLVC